MAVSKKKLLAALKHDLTLADTNKAGWDLQITQWAKEFNGEKYGNESKGKATVVSRDIKKASLWQHASIIDPFVSNDDVIRCTPVTHSDVETAKQAEQLLNFQFCRDFPRYQFVSDSFKVLQREGTAVARVSWEYEDEEIEVEEPIFEMVPIIDPMRAQQAMQQGLPPYEQIQVGTKTVTQTKVITNRPRVELMRNSMLWIDPTAENNIDDAKFVIYKYKVNMSELRSDGRYSNLDDIKVDGIPIYDPDSPYYRDHTFTFSDEPRKELEVIEYWGEFDMNDDGIAEPIVCTWIGDTIIRLENNPYPDQKIPFVSVAYDGDPYSIYGVSQGDTISTDQKIKTGIKRAILDTLDASTNGMRGHKKGSLDIVNKRKFESGEDFEYLGSTNDIWEGKFNTIPTDVLNFYSLIDRDIESLSGVKAFGAGNGGSALGSTAAAVNGTLDATAKRETDISRNYKENFLVPIMRKWYSMSAEFMDDEQIIRITDEEFVAIKRDDLQGRIDISMEVSTAEIDNEKSNNLSFMLQTMAQSLPFELTQILLAEQADLKNMPGLAKKISEYKPQPDPLEQELKQLEVDKLRAEVAERNSRANENQVDMRLKNAKADNEEAKARVGQSNADMTDLDFLQKQDGTKFSEEMTKATADEEAQDKVNQTNHAMRMREADQKATLDFMLDQNKKESPAASKK